MTRYFVETNVLAGLTYSHDRWHRDVKPLYQNNTLYTSEFVVYEYCNQRRRDPSIVSDPSQLSTDVDAEDGKYQHIAKILEDRVPFFDKQIRQLQREGMTVEKVVDAFIDHFEIRKQAEPQIRSYFQDYFSTRELTDRNARRAVQDLRDLILWAAERNKDILMENVKIRESAYHEMDEEREVIEAEIGLGEWGMSREDLQWVLDAIYTMQRGVLDRFVTGDKNDVAQFKHTLTKEFDIAVLYATEEFYSDDLVERPEEESIKTVDEAKSETLDD
ncbi:hypothetical protein [Haloarcula japonica]|uniref:DUF4935 domain-containing protein n=1 Tax=Haloarcula japonica (strain ATCC 49778 / DSM 6131 / JCM 7785 / NBRC 101032 / NCIMB 13157 / TR-1) TaxID=1227453 RepID=M0L7P3_HALJT|nr:hypothetical protein [Haloarcula japonica]EMA29103.1 hypothetical protein C444_17103 [Haloarcula japonica DSM 6131]